MSYPRIETIKKAVPETLTAKQKKDRRGEMVTIPGQALTLKTVIEQMAKGFPTPIQREEIKLPEDVNQVLQGTRFDVPSDIKFQQMSKTERQRVINNIAGIKSQLTAKLNQEIAVKQAKDAEISLKETPAPPPPEAPTV